MRRWALEEPLANDMRDSGVLHIDETSWRERSTLLWLWVFTTRTTVVFWISWRTSEILENVLGDSNSKFRKILGRRCEIHLMYSELKSMGNGPMAKNHLLDLMMR